MRHIFQCGHNSVAHDVDGILDAYRSVFQTDLTMSGPTVISKVIQAAASRASKYHVRPTCYFMPPFLVQFLINFFHFLCFFHNNDECRK